MTRENAQQNAEQVKYSAIYAAIKKRINERRNDGFNIKNIYKEAFNFVLLNEYPALRESLKENPASVEELVKQLNTLIDQSKNQVNMKSEADNLEDLATQVFAAERFQVGDFDSDYTDDNIVPLDQEFGNDNGNNRDR